MTHLGNLSKAQLVQRSMDTEEEHQQRIKALQESIVLLKEMGVKQRDVIDRQSEEYANASQHIRELQSEVSELKRDHAQLQYKYNREYARANTLMDVIVKLHEH